MGLPQQAGVDGSSLFRRSAPEDRGVYFETYQAWILHGYAPAAGWADARGKYLHAARPEFYDTTSDPGEREQSRRAARRRARALPRRHRRGRGKPPPCRAPTSRLTLDAGRTEGSRLRRRHHGRRGLPDPLDVAGRPSSARWARRRTPPTCRPESWPDRGASTKRSRSIELILSGNPDNWVVVLDYGFALLRAGRGTRRPWSSFGATKAAGRPTPAPS